MSGVEFDNTEKPWRVILNNELLLVQQKILTALRIWHVPTFPCRSPDMIGPFFIQLFTLLLCKGFSSQGVVICSFIMLVPFLLISMFLIKSIIKIKMANPSFGQIFCTMSYSQIYLVCFGFITRFVNSAFLHFLFLLPGLVLMLFSAYCLCIFLVPDDTVRLFASTFMIHGFFLAFWMIQSVNPFSN